MSTFNEAMSAKTSLRQYLKKDGWPPWLKGLDLGNSDDEGYYIRVIVFDRQNPEVLRLFPSFIMQCGKVKVVAEEP